MPVVEREETHARTELGAAQKDTARELGAKLSSLKGIVWVGVEGVHSANEEVPVGGVKALSGLVQNEQAGMLHQCPCQEGHPLQSRRERE